MKWASEIYLWTSGVFTFQTVISEVKELLEDKSMEEAKDVVTTFALWLYFRTGINLPLPSLISSYEKYEARIIAARDLLASHGLLNEERERAAPFYWAKYTQGGTNFAKPEKILKFLEAAKRDLEGEWI